MTQVLASYPDESQSGLDARTQSRLVRLGQRVRVTGLGHRRLAEADARSLATALLRDIDETILPRHVRVTTNTGRKFELDVAGRRVLRLIVPGGGEQIGTPDDPVDAARILAQELKRFLSQATELTLQTQRMASGHDRAEVGCSATGLASVMGLDLDALQGESITDKTLRALHRHSVAVHVTDGHGKPKHSLGDPSRAEELQSLAERHATDISKLLINAIGRGQKNGCVCLGTDDPSGAHLICTLTDQTRIIAWIDSRKIDAVLPILQDIFAR